MITRKSTPNVSSCRYCAFWSTPCTFKCWSAPYTLAEAQSPLSPSPESLWRKTLRCFGGGSSLHCDTEPGKDAMHLLTNAKFSLLDLVPILGAKTLYGTRMSATVFVTSVLLQAKQLREVIEIRFLVNFSPQGKTRARFWTSFAQADSWNCDDHKIFRRDGWNAYQTIANFHNLVGPAQYKSSFARKGCSLIQRKI